MFIDSIRRDRKRSTFQKSGDVSKKNHTPSSQVKAPLKQKGVSSHKNKKTSEDTRQEQKNKEKDPLKQQGNFPKSKHHKQKNSFGYKGKNPHPKQASFSKQELRGGTDRVNTQKSSGKNSPVPIVKPKTLRIIPIGGQEEVGRNMTIFEYENDIVIVDMGMQFPEEDMPGIDYIVPNTDYLKGREKNIRGVIFTHGHLDHIGAAPILLEKLGYPPIIGRDLTLAMIKKKVEDHNPGSVSRLKTIHVKSFRDTVRLGSFQAGFFDVEHSIMDAIGVVLATE
ncbi:MAG: ribonuclease J, partial [Candidatus Moranbacteria bacterium]|nr:ribonuclease J [Candidatus Moranbacteria bacterium]